MPCPPEERCRAFSLPTSIHRRTVSGCLWRNRAASFTVTISFIAGRVYHTRAILTAVTDRDRFFAGGVGPDSGLFASPKDNGSMLQYNATSCNILQHYAVCGRLKT